MPYNLGFVQNAYGVDYMNRELEYWRQRLNDALNTSRHARHPYPHDSALRESLKALEIYWFGDNRDRAEWNAVCDSAFKAIDGFNEWRNRK